MNGEIRQTDTPPLRWFKILSWLMAESALTDCEMMKVLHLDDVRWSYVKRGWTDPLPQHFEVMADWFKVEECFLIDEYLPVKQYRTYPAYFQPSTPPSVEQ